MDVRRGEVYFIHKGNVSEYGAEQQSGRPAIIVSNDKGNLTSEAVEVVWLTTQPKRDMRTHVKISSTNKDSTALCEQITTVDKARIGDYVCTLSNKELVMVEDALAISLDLYDLMYPADGEKQAITKVPEQAQDNKNDELVVKLQTERDIYKELYLGLLGKLTG